MKSKIIKSVIKDIELREVKGIETYDETMDRIDLTQDMWLNHAYEEALDFAIYLKKIITLRNGNE